MVCRHMCGQEASREKARALEKAQEDLEAANAELEDMRHKLEGAKARAKVVRCGSNGAGGKIR
jgi:peptidoglycan hydrolase CwlO-like protein